jgi:tRNA-binding EMAP/Myf-like protein
MGGGADTETPTGIVIATVLAAEPVPGAARLHRITLEVAGGRTVQVASGLPGDLLPGAFIGKQIPIQVGGIEPRTIRGVRSEARLLATADDNGRPVLLVPEHPVPPGAEVW